MDVGSFFRAELYNNTSSSKYDRCSNNNQLFIAIIKQKGPLCPPPAWPLQSRRKNLTHDGPTRDWPYRFQCIQRLVRWKEIEMLEPFWLKYLLNTKIWAKEVEWLGVNWGQNGSRIKKLSYKGSVWEMIFELQITTYNKRKERIKCHVARGVEVWADDEWWGNGVCKYIAEWLVLQEIVWCGLNVECGRAVRVGSRILEALCER